jgi:hypothetical protein
VEEEEEEEVEADTDAVDFGPLLPFLKDALDEVAEGWLDEAYPLDFEWRNMLSSGDIDERVSAKWRSR